MIIISDTSVREGELSVHRRLTEIWGRSRRASSTLMSHSSRKMVAAPCRSLQAFLALLACAGYHSEEVTSGTLFRHGATLAIPDIKRCSMHAHRYP